MSNCADELALLEHWHHHKSSCPRDFDEGDDAVVFRDVGLIGPEVGNVYNPFCFSEAFEWDSRMVAQVDYRVAPPIIGIAVRCGSPRCERYRLRRAKDGRT